MNEENKVNYYSVIPATVRYDKRLKFAERLLYGEITALSNSNGFCYAKNRYFADLYEVTTGTVSKWISHLQELGYIKVEIIKNEKQEIISRHIYISDIPYISKKTYPYNSFEPYPMVEKDKYNNINRNIDDLFYLIINNKSKIPTDFYMQLERLEFIYTNEILQIMQEENIQKLKDIVYTLFCIYQSNFKMIIPLIDRNTLVNLYISCKNHNTKDFLNYYRQAIINKYTERSWEMLESYINNFENIVSSTLFIVFKITLIILVTLLILSLILLGIGCLIKSQKLKSKFLIAVPSLIVGIVFLLVIPPIFVHFKNMI